MLYIYIIFPISAFKGASPISPLGPLFGVTAGVIPLSFLAVTELQEATKKPPGTHRLGSDGIAVRGDQVSLRHAQIFTMPSFS